MFNTFINLHQGPRVLEQTLSMRSLAHTGVLFDNLYISSFGWGGDPNNVARIRVSKDKWYNFSSSFRRDQNYFNYDLFSNPMNNNLVATIPASADYISFSPHAFAVTRRMADLNLTLLPQSKFTVRAGYSRNRANGPSITTNHEAGDTLMVQPWNTTYQTVNVGFDMKFIPKTNISFDQFLQYGKQDTNTLLDPSTGVGSFATYPFQNPTAVGGVTAVEFGLVPSASCILASGYAKTSNCSGYFNYNRYQRVRTTIPTSQLALQSRPHKNIEITGRFAYSAADLHSDYNEVFNGLVTRTFERGWTISGPVTSQGVTGSGDFAVTVHLTDKLTLSNSFRYLNQRMPSLSQFAEQILMINNPKPKIGATSQTYNFTDCINPTTGALLITATNDPTKYITAPDGTRAYYCHYEEATGAEAAVNNFFGQSFLYDTTELSYQFTKKIGARAGYRFGSRSINDIRYPNETDPLQVQKWNIDEHTALFGAWIRPSHNFRTSLELELTSNTGFTDRIAARNQQHYRIRTSYSPVKEFTITGTANILENRNGFAEIDYKGHNRNIGFSAVANPSKKVAFDLSYNYGNYLQNAWMCFVDNLTTGFTLPSSAGAAGSCPTSGYNYNDGSFQWWGGGSPAANPATNRLIYSTFENTTHYGSFTIRFQPVKRVTANLGYGVTSVSGNTQQLNQVLPLGSLNYNFHQPLASLSIEMAKNLSFNTYWNYDQYKEGDGLTGLFQTSPRYFHDNRAVLSVRYAF